MQIPLLLIGSAFDGPSGEIVQVSSIEQAFDLFGGYIYERVELDSTTKTFEISSETANSVDFFTWEDGELTEFSAVSSVSVSGSTVTMEQLGYDLDVVVRYLRDFSADSSYLYKGYAEVNSSVGGEIHVLRVGGTKSVWTGSFNDGASITLESRYAGSLYNQTQAFFDGDNLVVTQPPGKGETRSYSYIGKTPQELASEINLDYLKGYLCVMAATSGTCTISSASPDDTPVSFSGGTDGEFTDSDILDALEQTNLSGVRVASILGMQSSLSPGDHNDLKDVLTDSVLSDLQYPTMFVQGVRRDQDVTGSDIPILLSALEPSDRFYSQNVSLVVGDCVFNYYPVSPYSASIAPVYAGILSQSDHGCVFRPSGAHSISPLLSESEAASLAALGYVTFTNSVSRGVVPYSDVTTRPDWDAACYHLYLSAVDSLYPILEGLPGQQIRDQATLQDEIESAIASLRLVKSYEVAVDTTAYGTVRIDITLLPYGKVSSIQFGVSLNASTASS